MRDFWAERLLASVMNWPAERVANERPLIQAMASYKYDTYQQYAPGLRFVESLALWLKQFEQMTERETAYRFVRERLVFISSAELYHLANVAYPDVVRPWLMRVVADEIGLPHHSVAKIRSHPVYKQRLRQCLFAGLSDGAQIGTFRRANRAELSNEQILQSHEIAPERARVLLEKLRNDLRKRTVDEDSIDESSFRTVVFVDDFSGSGRSCIRKKSARGEWTGKLPKSVDAMMSGRDASLGNTFGRRDADESRTSKHDLIESKNFRVLVLLYVASESALTYLRSALADYWKDKGLVGIPDAQAVHIIREQQRVLRSASSASIVPVQDRYFDTDITDENFLVGETDGKFGFNDAGLPLVLFHNTPNNSLSLLFAYYHCNPRGLFPRVTRHLEI